MVLAFGPFSIVRSVCYLPHWFFFVYLSLSYATPLLPHLCYCFPPFLPCCSLDFNFFLNSFTFWWHVHSQIEFYWKIWTVHSISIATSTEFHSMPYSHKSLCIFVHFLQYTFKYSIFCCRSQWKLKRSRKDLWLQIL